MEWAVARFGQIIPCNWGYKHAIHWVPACAPLGYMTVDAQNLIVKGFLESDSDWLFFIEQDNVLPPDCFIRMNDYMRKNEVPIVSGLYFTKSAPAEPLVYRGRGNSYYADWKIGDLVWCDAVPTGCVIIHRSIIEVLWNNSEKYVVGNPPQETRRVFQMPERVWYDPELGWDNSQGTSDMEFCSRVIVENVFEKAGWSNYVGVKYPFLIDTNIFVWHIAENGLIFPSPSEKQKWMPHPESENGKLKPPRDEPDLSVQAAPKALDLAIQVGDRVGTVDKMV